ncbi:MAG: ATP/cobalamin adenosyltransferase [Thermovirga lienii]|jgi:cob(I)alamin adenosyltransferase|nr:MAG: ATP/cobalamin adenosyltransferase [Thermovirga lienii]
MDVPWITTKKGDKGLTTLGNGEKVPKDHPRVELYGTLDECQAAIGIARAHCAFEEINAHLLEIENMLGTLMGHLSLFPGVPCPEYQALEKIISHVGTIVGEKKHIFLRPGDSKVGSFLHLARTIARRAERKAVKLYREGKIEDKSYIFINRLSDAIFALALWLNMEEKQSSAD